MSIAVVKLDPYSQWDQNMLNQLWANQLTPTGLSFAVSEQAPGESHHTALHRAGEVDGIILIIPGRYWYDRTDEISDAIKNFDWVLGIRTGDEQDLFDIHKVVHPNIRWWVQTPPVDRYTGEDVRKFGVGWTPHFNCPQLEPPDVHHADVDLFLAAQNTHPRRFEAFAILNCIPGTQIVRHESAGFTQGLDPFLYTMYMIHSKVAFAPAGPDTPDTFRLYEALQAHTIPIADDLAANYGNRDTRGYWEMIFPDAPFPVITDWSETPGMVRQLIEAYPANANRITAWWMRQKRSYVDWLHEDLNLLGGLNTAEGCDAGSAVTAVIPVSPIPSHPDTRIIEQTIDSVRHWLPDSEIIVTFDGVRSEQEDMREAYEEAMRRTLWMCDYRWRNVTPLIFEEHRHQSGMMVATLKHIHTPLVLYVEQDTPLVTDEPIDWESICGYILDGQADLVRFHHEAQVLDVHKHLMQERDGAFWRTTQWSQRPHIASKGFYINAMTHFTPEAKCFIEERLAGPAQQQPGWKLYLYHPNETNIKRSLNLDGRAGGPQFLDSQVF